MGLFGLNDAAQQAANTPAAQQASNIITSIADAAKNIIGAVTTKPGMPPVNSPSGGSGGSGYTGFGRGNDLWFAVGGVAVVVGVGYYLMHHKSGGGAARRASQRRAYSRYRAYRRSR